MRSKRSPTQFNLFAAIDPRLMRGASPSPGVHATSGAACFSFSRMLRDFARSFGAFAGPGADDAVTIVITRSPMSGPAVAALGSTPQGEDR